MYHELRRGAYSHFGVDSALDLLDLAARASFVEQILYIWPESGARALRPCALAGRSVDEDARLLQAELQHPADRVSELHRRLSRALDGIAAWLGNSQQAILRMPAAAWPGFHLWPDDREAAVEFSLRFGRLTAAETRLAVENARQVTRIAREFIDMIERVRRDIAEDDPLIDLKRLRLLPRKEWGAG